MADNKVTFDQLYEIAKRVDPENAIRLLALTGKESTFGENPAAYKPNKFGVIGPAQIMSKALGGKYGNFEQYAAPGKTDVYNPLHTAEAGMRMAADLFKKRGVDQGTMDYLGRGKKDALGTTPKGYLSDIVALEQKVKAKLPQQQSAATMAQTDIASQLALLEDPAYRRILENAGQISTIADAGMNAGKYNLGPSSPLGTTIQDSAKLLSDMNARQNARFQDNPDQSFLERAFSRIVGGSGDAMFAQGAKEQLTAATDAQKKIADLSTAEIQAAMAPANALGLSSNALANLIQYTQPTAAQKAQLAEQQRSTDLNAGLRNREVTLAEQIQPAKLEEQRAITGVRQAELGLAQNQVQTQRESVQQFREAAKTIGVDLPQVVNVNDYAKQLSPQLYNAIASVSTTGSLGADPQSALAQSQIIPNSLTPQTAAGWGAFVSGKQIPAKDLPTVLKQFGVTNLTDEKTKQAVLAKVSTDRVRASIAAAKDSGTGAGWESNPYRWNANDFKAHGSDPRLVAIPGWAGVAAAAANGGMLNTKDAVSLLIQGKPLDQATDSVVKAFTTITNLNNSEFRKFKLMGAPVQDGYKAGSFDLTKPASAQLYITTLKREQEMMSKYRADNPFSSRLDAVSAILTNPEISGNIDRLGQAAKFAVTGTPDVKSVLGD